MSGKVAAARGLSGPMTELQPRTVAELARLSGMSVAHVAEHLSGLARLARFAVPHLVDPIVVQRGDSAGETVVTAAPGFTGAYAGWRRHGTNGLGDPSAKAERRIREMITLLDLLCGVS